MNERVFTHLYKFLWAVVILIAGQADATKAQELQIDTILEGLSQPSGLAFHPETQVLYVSDSGNGKVMRVVEGSTEDVITGYPIETISPDFGFKAGPLGISFLSDNRLVVGSGCWETGMDRISVFELEDLPRTADDELYSRSISSSGNGQGEGDFFGIVADDDVVYATGRGDTKFGWVSRMVRKKDDTIVFKPFIDTWQATATRLPTAITISPDGFVVVGQRGENGASSVLAMYDQTDGDLRAKFDLPKNGIIAMDYGPHAGRLFALFNSSHEPEQNGLYKLIGRNRNTRCELELIHQIDDPLALSFSPDGELFIATGGQDGKLIKVSGLDNPPETLSDQSN